jgi:hypothetical protein
VWLSRQSLDSNLGAATNWLGDLGKLGFPMPKFSRVLNRNNIFFIMDLL